MLPIISYQFSTTTTEYNNSNNNNRPTTEYTTRTLNNEIEGKGGVHKIHAHTHTLYISSIAAYEET